MILLQSLSIRSNLIVNVLPNELLGDAKDLDEFIRKINEDRRTKQKIIEHLQHHIRDASGREKKEALKTNLKTLKNEHKNISKEIKALKMSVFVIIPAMFPFSSTTGTPHANECPLAFSGLQAHLNVPSSVFIA